MTPVWFRRRAFWQGVSDQARRLYLASRDVALPAEVKAAMPLDRAYWSFINNSQEPPTEDGLDRLRGLGYVLAKSGFMPIA